MFKKKEQKEDMIERDYILYIPQMLTAEVMCRLWASGRAFWDQWKDFHQLWWVSDRTTHLEWSRVCNQHWQKLEGKKKSKWEEKKGCRHFCCLGYEGSQQTPLKTKQIHI